MHFVPQTKKLRGDAAGLSQVSAPLVSVLYNKYMGGVDTADKLRAQFNLSNAFSGDTKAYQRVWVCVMEAALVNSYKLWLELEARRISRLPKQARVKESGGHSEISEIQTFLVRSRSAHL